MLARFWDEESGGFIDTASDHADQALIMRPKNITDSAIPSDNVVVAAVLTWRSWTVPTVGQGKGMPVMAALSKRCACWVGVWPVTRAPLARH